MADDAEKTVDVEEPTLFQSIGLPPRQMTLGGFPVYFTENASRSKKDRKIIEEIQAIDRSRDMAFRHDEKPCLDLTQGG